MGKTRVLIVDDSALVRKLLSDILNSDSEIEVVATAANPFIARDKIKKHNPHVITLDVEMPKMNGITFLHNLMRLHPMPVVMVSTLTEKGASVTMQALELGAVDFVPKPKINLTTAIDDYAEEIISKVKMARHANVKCLQEIKVRNKAKPTKVEKAHLVDEVLPYINQVSSFHTSEQIIAIGASTGGTEAVRSIVEELPENFPGIVIAQHIPAGFSKAFAKRLDAVSAMQVHEAEDGQQIIRGHVYVAPGDYHLLVVRDGKVFRCKLTQDVPVNRHRPSVDVLFRSVAQSLGDNTIGVILTGMGKDGAIAIKEIHETGAYTIAQDEQSSVVWGMPGAAVELGGIDRVLPLNQIAEYIQKLSAKREKKVVTESIQAVGSKN